MVIQLSGKPRKLDTGEELAIRLVQAPNKAAQDALWDYCLAKSELTGESAIEYMCDLESWALDVKQYITP